MPSYIGKEPQQAYNSPDKDRFSGDGSTTEFTLSRTVANAADLEVFVGNVQQEPLVAYTTSAQTLTFTGAPATGSNNIYVVHRNGGMQTLALPTGQAGDFSSVTASGDVSVTGDLTVTGNIIGDVEITGTTPKLTIGDAGAEDSTLLFDGNAQDYYIALDDSADDLLIGLGSTVGTTPALAIDENLLATFHGGITMAGTTPTLTIGDAGAEDTKIVFDGNAKDFYVGLDDSADKLVIGEGSTVGTNNILTITDDTVTIGDAAAVDTALVFDGNAQDYYIALDDSADDLLIGLGSTVGTTPAISIDENLAVTTYGDITMTGATPTLTIGDAGAEDAKIVFDGNAQDFHIGLDDSADDLVIGKGSALGTTPAISIDENLKTTFGGATVGATNTANATGSTTLDFDAYQNFVLTFTGNVTLANPSTESVGQSGIIVIIQDGTGSRTIAVGTDYEWPAGTATTISTAGGAVDIIPYFIKAANSIQLGAAQLAFA